MRNFCHKVIHFVKIMLQQSVKFHRRYSCTTYILACSLSIPIFALESRTSTRTYIYWSTFALYMCSACLLFNCTRRSSESVRTLHVVISSFQRIHFWWKMAKRGLLFMCSYPVTRQWLGTRKLHPFDEWAGCESSYFRRASFLSLKSFHMQDEVK